mmetsp:Transcript_30692/g.54534  ORF Transcript_30692/g.54534 Transcript_30692/m.54534 type:complete len:117 (+) Transcript_30692:180-530(+)
MPPSREEQQSAWPKARGVLGLALRRALQRRLDLQLLAKVDLQMLLRVRARLAGVAMLLALHFCLHQVQACVACLSMKGMTIGPSACVEMSPDRGSGIRGVPVSERDDYRAKRLCRE